MSTPPYISEDELLQLVKKLNVETDLADGDMSQTTDISKRDVGESGKVRIQNNKIIIEKSPNAAELTTIQAVHPVVLLKNGHLYTDKTIIEPGDKIEWVIEPEEMFRIEVSDDKMEAYFRLVMKKRYGWKLPDQEPRTHLIVEAVRDDSVILETVSVADVMRKLQNMKIVKNIITGAIFQELTNPSHERILVAHGVELVPSQDARIELYFFEEVKNVIQVDQRTGTIDLRNHLQIPSVKNGELIARKIPMKSGVIGYNVFGELIKPNPPKDITIIAKEHVTITADGEVYAQKEGRPRVTGTTVKCFDITTSFVVTGDVDLKTGNIVFSGDVIVYGNVMEGMIIESLGNVNVFGNVYHATITATGSIMIKGNVIHSNLYSGYFGVVFNRLYVSCKTMDEQLGQVIQAGKLLYHLIESKGRTVRIGQILMTLIESKFKDIPKLAAETMLCVQNIQNISQNEMDDLKEKIGMLLEPMRILSFDSYDHIYAIQNMAQETHQMIERMQESAADIDIEQCHISNLKSTGDILVRKEGVLQSQLYCKGNIIFYDQDSVCRGGQLEAQGTITAMSVGGDLGNETLLKAGKRITLQQMNYGRIWIGKFGREILNPMKNVIAYVENNTLVVESE